MTKLCCTLNAYYYCGECATQECFDCWVEGMRMSHYRQLGKIYCDAKQKYVGEGNFQYLGPKEGE
jgi:hypothetical protein